MSHGVDYEQEFKRLAIERGVLESELTLAIRAAQIQHEPGKQQQPVYEAVQSSRSIQEVVEDISRVDKMIDAAIKMFDEVRHETLELAASEGNLSRINAITEVAEVIKKVIDPDLPKVHTEVQFSSNLSMEKAFAAPDAPSPVDALLMMSALAAGVLASKTNEAKTPEAPMPNEKAVERCPESGVPERRTVESQTYDVPSGASFSVQPAPIVVIGQRGQSDLDPVLKKQLDSIEEKYEKKSDGLEQKIDQLQQKFDERHQQRAPQEKQELQQKLDQQFSELRNQLSKAEAQERQRALDEKAWRIEQQQLTQRINEFQQNRDDLPSR